MAQWIKDQMASNSAAWHNSDQNERKRLEAENQRLGAQIGGQYNASAGTWSDSSGNALYQPKNSNVASLSPSTRDDDVVVSLNPKTDNTPNQFGYSNGVKSDGGGYLDSVNRALDPNIREDNYGFSDDTLSVLKGRGSGQTLNQYGYSDHYINKIEEATKTRDSHIEDGRRPWLVDSYNTMLESYGTQQSQYNEFADWDTGLLEEYIHNKRKAEQSKDPEEKARLAAINQQLRNFYDMEEDKYSSGDLGKLSSDILYGDFLKYGLNKEENYKDIPAIGSTDDNYDPKFEAARMMSRRDNLHGYEPLGQVVGERGEAMRADTREREANMIEAIKNGQPIDNPLGLQNQAKETQQIADHLSKSLESSGISINGELNIDSNVSIGQNGESMYKTNQGYFATTKDGHAIKIEEDNYNKMLMSMYGIEPIYSPTNPDTVKPNSDVSLSASGTGEESIQTKGNKELEANKAKTALENGYITDYGAPKPILNTFIESARSMIDWNYSQSKRMSEGSVDCSSLIGRAMQMAGITNDPFVTTESMTRDKRFTKISKSEIQPGDILWEKGHAAIFLGNNKTLEARYSTKKVGESTLGTRFTHAYRINV